MRAAGKKIGRAPAMFNAIQSHLRTFFVGEADAGREACQQRLKVARPCIPHHDTP